MDSQSNIVLTTNGREMLTANKAFLDFFGVKDIEEFVMLHGACICNMFEKRDGYIQKSIDGITWINYILKNKNLISNIILQVQYYYYVLTNSKFVENNFPLTPNWITKKFSLDKPSANTFLYADVAGRGQVGQSDYPWEQLDELEWFKALV